MSSQGQGRGAGSGPGLGLGGRGSLSDSPASASLCEQPPVECVLCALPAELSVLLTFKKPWNQRPRHRGEQWPGVGRKGKWVLTFRFEVLRWLYNVDVVNATEVHDGKFYVVYLTTMKKKKFSKHADNRLGSEHTLLWFGTIGTYPSALRHILCPTISPSTLTFPAAVVTMATHTQTATGP